MYATNSFDGSKNTAAPKGLTALLIGVVVLYQVFNYTVLHSALPEEDGYDSDGACSATADGGGASSLCMEARLFKGWHEMPSDSPAELEQLLAVSPSTTVEQQPSTTFQAPVSRAATDAPRSMRGQGGESASGAEAAQAPQAVDSILKAKPDALEASLWDLVFKMGGGDQTHTPPEKSRTMDPVVKQAAPSMRGAAKARKKERKKASAQEMVDLQQELSVKMKAKARKHAEHRALKALSMAARGTHQNSKVPSEGDGMTPWAHNLDDLTHELQDHMEARRKARAEYDKAHSKAHELARSTVHTRTQAKETEHGGDHSLIGEINELGSELCKDPSRHALPVCAQFLKSQSTSSTSSDLDSQARQDRKSAIANDMAHIKLLEKHLEELHEEEHHHDELLKQESTVFLTELCSDPARSSYPACAKILAERGTTAPVSTPPKAPKMSESAGREKKGLRGENLRPSGLQWPSVKEWESRSKSPHGIEHIDTTPAVFFRQDLRGDHWTGKIPKVACITVLSPGQATETLMKYFMDNYKLQNYEGQRQLVLVYHNKDKATARIAHKYADGSSVVAVAARDEGEFPSAMAYRFGAWVAKDADAVARWDFDAWHHPNRLAMQIHSMILGKRSASVVTRATFFDAAGGNTTKLGGIGRHGSMLGEAAWMRKHWMPLLEEENQVLLGVQARHVAQVEMPELLAYHDA